MSEASQGDFWEDTLAIARRTLFAALDEGAVCPCCSQYARRYRRKLYATQAKQLIGLYRLNKQDSSQFFHRTVVVREANNNDLGFLRHWGLLELKPLDDDEDKKDSGLYRITTLGALFVEDLTRVPKYLIQYNNNVEGFSSDMVSIRDVLGTKFSYEELMNE